jgi:putative peptidoglycan lipid II flippase
VRATLVLSAPVLVSLSVLQVNPLIDRTMAAGLGDGKVTALELGLRLFLVPAGLVTGLLLSPITATWAARHAAGGLAALEASVAEALRTLLVWVPPLVIIGFAVRRQAVEVLFAGGAYPASALHDTAEVLGMIVLSLPAQAVTVVLATLFIVQKDTRFPMKIALANVVLNTCLNLALRPEFGVAGIALSTTLTYTLLACVYVRATVRRWGRGMLRAQAVLARSVVSVAATAGAAAVLLAVLPTAHSRPSALLAVAVVAGGGLLAHAAVLAVRTSA